MDDDQRKPAGADPAEGSPGYPASSEGYSDCEENPDGDGRAGSEGDTGTEGGRREFWKPLGFETFRDYINYMNRMQDLYAPLPRTARPPAPEISELDTAQPQPPRPSYTRRRQLNVKLRDHEADALERAADIYGLRPATLARVLVNRGVDAVLERFG